MKRGAPVKVLTDLLSPHLQLLEVTARRGGRRFDFYVHYLSVPSSNRCVEATVIRLSRLAPV